MRQPEKDFEKTKREMDNWIKNEIQELMEIHERFLREIEEFEKRNGQA